MNEIYYWMWPWEGRPAEVKKSPAEFSEVSYIPKNMCEVCCALLYYRELKGHFYVYAITLVPILLQPPRDKKGK